MCLNFFSLILEGNFVCVLFILDSSEIEDYDYRWIVKNIIFYFKILDEEVFNLELLLLKKKNVFDDDWVYLEELQRDVGIGGLIESFNLLGKEMKIVFLIK